MDLVVFANHSEPEVEDTFDYYNINDRLSLLLQPHEILRIILCISSLCLNLFMLLALYQVKSRITIHYRLIISLAMSDLVVGFSVFFHYVRKIFSPLYYPLGVGPYSQRMTSMCSYMFVKSLNTIGLNINLMNLMLMALDHYVAIFSPLKYPLTMTKRRVIPMIIGIWVIAILLGLSDFFSAIKDKAEWKDFNYCEKVGDTLYEGEYSIFIIAPICLGVIIYVYIRIYMKVKSRNIPGNSSMNREVRRHSKALITTLLNIGAFIVSWMPLCLFEITLVIKADTDPLSLVDNQKTLMHVNYHLMNLLIMHAIADPIIYTVRMKEVSLS